MLLLAVLLYYPGFHWSIIMSHCLNPVPDAVPCRQECSKGCAEYCNFLPWTHGWTLNVYPQCVSASALRNWLNITIYWWLRCTCVIIGLLDLCVAGLRSRVMLCHFPSQEGCICIYPENIMYPVDYCWFYPCCTYHTYITGIP